MVFQKFFQGQKWKSEKQDDGKKFETLLEGFSLDFKNKGITLVPVAADVTNMDDSKKEKKN